jgi:hypothetical protein
MLSKLAATVLALVAFASNASAQAARNARIDVIDIKVVALVNLNTQSLRAEATITFQPLDANFQAVHFELNEALKVSKVTDGNGEQLNATRVGEHTLRVNYPDPFSKSENKTVVITYDGRLAGQEESPVFGIRFAAIRQDFAYLLTPARWFPVNEYIVDRYSSEFTIGVPEGYRVLGGGVETKESGASGDIYKIKYTQPGFGGSLAIVKSDPVRVTSEGATTAVYFRTAADQAQGYGEETGKILSYFAGLFGTAPSTSLTLVETERGGPAGWSGPGIIFLSPGTIGQSVNSRGLANQIARQWWGQWLSPASRNHLWITNGMARYAELMYLEQTAGPSVFEQDIRDSYVEALTMSEVPLVQSARLEDFSPEFWALTGAKGATVYHMARHVMGDEKFWQTIKDFLSQYGNKSVTTEQLRQVASNIFGEDLGYFFIQWIESSGAPEFKLQYTVFRTQQGFRIVGKVTQDLDTFRMPVNLKIETEGNPEMTKVEIAGTSSEFAINTFGKPIRIVLDPEGAVLRWSDDIRVAVAIRRGEQFAEINDFGEALKEYQKALDVRRASSLAHYRVAEIFFLQNNYQSAANAFREALNGDLEPKWTEVWSRINLGKIFDVTGQRDRAVNEYNLALRTKDNTQGAQEEAAKFLKEPYRRAVAGN